MSRHTITFGTDDTFELNDDWGVSVIRCGDLVLSFTDDRAVDSLQTALWALALDDEVRRDETRRQLEHDAHASEGARTGEDA